MSGFNRQIRRKAKKTLGITLPAKKGGATAPNGDQKDRRLPEKGDKFVLAGPDFVSPVLFTMAGDWNAGEVTIRMCDARDFPMLDPNERSKEARGYEPPSKPADPRPAHFHTPECNHG